MVLGVLALYLGEVMEVVWGGGGWFARMSYWQHISNFRFMYWGWMLCFLAPFFFLCSAKKLKYVTSFLQSFKVRRGVLLILMGSQSSLNYLFWLLSRPPKKHILQGENIQAWLKLFYHLKNKLLFLSLFLSNMFVHLFWPFLTFVHFSKKAKEEEGFKGTCGI